MKAYVGSPRAKHYLKRCREEGIGACVVRGELKGRRLDSFFYDNGAFVDRQKGRAFNGARYMRDLSVMRMQGLRPDFVVLPDIVGGGLESFKLSREWLDFTKEFGFPVYLAVQDGTTPQDISPQGWRALDGIFVGGSMNWKLAHMGEWCRAAHAHGLKCHVGRIGTPKRVDAARRAQVDSIDSAAPLWTREKFEDFALAVRGPGAQKELFG